MNTATTTLKVRIQNRNFTLIIVLPYQNETDAYNGN